MTDQIKAAARRLGFNPVGIASADPPQHWAFYQKWLGMGYAGEMGYLGRNLDRRSDVRQIVPNAKSVLCAGLNYLPDSDASENGSHPKGQIARYARGDDYHAAMKDRLFELLAEIQRIEPSAEGRVYVDTGPVLERDFAARAGLGWFGKHTCLIDKGRGSWFFFGRNYFESRARVRSTAAGSLRHLYAVLGCVSNRRHCRTLSRGFAAVYFLFDH